MPNQERLSGCRIIVTRPADRSDEAAGRLRALGAEVRSRPLIAIGPPGDPAVLREALGSLERYSWLAFTSANAVRACVLAAAPGTRWPRVACVGSGTARAATAAGIPVDLVPADFSGEALADTLVEQLSPGARVLWPRASGAREAFAAKLRAARIEVDEVECYRTVPDTEAAAALRRELERAPADVCVFTSPSAVRALAATGTDAPAAAVAVIGGVTAAAVAEAGWQVRIRPGEQSIPGLVSAVADWWSARG